MLLHHQVLGRAFQVPTVPELVVQELEFLAPERAAQGLVQVQEPVVHSARTVHLVHLVQVFPARMGLAVVHWCLAGPVPPGFCRRQGLLVAPPGEAAGPAAR